MPYSEYNADDELAAYGAIFSSLSPVGISTIFDSLLHRVSENRFKSVNLGVKGELRKTECVCVSNGFKLFIFSSVLFLKRIRIAKYLGNR